VRQPNASVDQQRRSAFEWLSRLWHLHLFVLDFIEFPRWLSCKPLRWKHGHPVLARRYIYASNYYPGHYPGAPSDIPSPRPECCDGALRAPTRCVYTRSRLSHSVSHSQPTPLASDNITAAFNVLNLATQFNGTTYSNQTYLALGPLAAGSINATAANGASMTLAAGANVSLVITAANGTQTCTITGGAFPYVALVYTLTTGRVTMSGCPVANCSNSTGIWSSSNSFSTSTGCIVYPSGGQIVYPPSAYCVSTCNVVNFTAVGSNPSVYLTSNGTWYANGTNATAVVFGGFNSVVPGPPAPPPAPNVATVRHKSLCPQLTRAV